MLYIDPRGVREGIALIFFWKRVFEKHPSAPPATLLLLSSRLRWQFLALIYNRHNCHMPFMAPPLVNSGPIEFDPLCTMHLLYFLESTGYRDVLKSLPKFLLHTNAGGQQKYGGHSHLCLLCDLPTIWLPSCGNQRRSSTCFCLPWLPDPWGEPNFCAKVVYSI